MGVDMGYVRGGGVAISPQRHRTSTVHYECNLQLHPAKGRATRRDREREKQKAYDYLRSNRLQRSAQRGRFVPRCNVVSSVFVVPFWSVVRGDGGLMMECN